ncbi:hypothetical protein, partial [Ferrovibrio sp.]|uniref:hypothetical protein n=1 Tax=Ferrovibrio sp. TaxID=1917215 RepID=UPI00263253B9
MNQLAALLLLGVLGNASLGGGDIAIPAQAQTTQAQTTQAQNTVQAPSTEVPDPPPVVQPAIVPPGGPPAGSLSLSQIIAQIESRPDCAFIRDIDWVEGRYEVEYRTRDGRDRVLKIDPRTGR